MGTVDSLGSPAFQAPGGDERLPLPTVGFRLASVSGNEGKSQDCIDTGVQRFCSRCHTARLKLN
ncbi:hypothetical protein DPMN_027223 [Dreissena polymorpha]|uniref:Uncharacterized protein n=1 Tax=Dreissena polymorpha TaxID=45954 RepID=A0A9D4LUV4_DREPO|nr:hypothetical protein DPMN_027223 [Dreissena polymorpha]